MLASLAWFAAATVAYVVDPGLADVLGPLSAGPLVVAVVILVIRSERMRREHTDRRM